MKIIIVSDGLPDGKRLVGLFEADQAKALQNAGHDVCLMVYSDYSITYSRKFGTYKTTYNGITVYVRSLPIGRHPLRLCAEISSPFFKSFTKSVLRDFGEPDIVHAHFSYLGYLVTKNRNLFSCPIIITEHSSRINRNRIDSNLERISKYAYTHADAVISVSNVLKNRIWKHFSVKSKCIPNVINTELFDKENDRTDKIFRFVSVGNLIPLKNMNLLISAFIKAFTLSPNITLTIFGDGVERQNLLSLINNLGGKKIITLAGCVSREDIAKLYEKANCFVLASKSETFGISYVEAMAAGLPVIATKCGGPEDFITDEIGLMIPVDDEEALVKALCTMVSTHTLYNKQEIKRNALKYSGDSIAAQLINLYESLIKKESHND